MVKPNISIKAKPPTSDSGMATRGTKAERKLPSVRKITAKTISPASQKVRTTSRIEAWMNSVES